MGHEQRLMQLLLPIHESARLTARRLCRSDFDGDDLFQEAALRALLRLSELRDESRFRAWFYAVLLSVHRERSRRSFWRRFLPFLNFSDGKDSDRRDLQAATEGLGRPYEEARGESARLSQALSRLPAKQREAVVLFEVDGYSLEEVAELQGDSLSAVKSRLSRGRQLLRRHYDALDDKELETPLLAARPSKEAPHG